MICNQCKSSFNSIFEFDDHFNLNKCVLEENKKPRTVKGKPRPKLLGFKCEHCSMTFNYEQDLQKHERIHSAEWHEQNFVCDICDKRFRQMKELTMHLCMYECIY